MKNFFNRLMNILSVTRRKRSPDVTCQHDHPSHEKKDRPTFLVVRPDGERCSVVATDNDTLPDTRTSCNQPLPRVRRA
jgi:hypothetical protein